jgi:hypothetical protein
MCGIQPQFGDLFGRQKASVPERICSLGIRLCSGSLRFASFARLKKADAQRCRTSESFGFKSERLYGGARRNFCPRPCSSTAACRRRNSKGEFRRGSERASPTPRGPVYVSGEVDKRHEQRRLTGGVCKVSFCARLAQN